MSNAATTPAPASAPAVPPPVDKIRIKVDGREVEVPKLMPNWQGKLEPTTMLQACVVAGIDLPHYCYHPKLPVAAPVVCSKPPGLVVVPGTSSTSCAKSRPLRGICVVYRLSTTWPTTALSVCRA